MAYLWHGPRGYSPLLSLSRIDSCCPQLKPFRHRPALDLRHVPVALTLVALRYCMGILPTRHHCDHLLEQPDAFVDGLQLVARKSEASDCVATFTRRDQRVLSGKDHVKADIAVA